MLKAVLGEWLSAIEIRAILERKEMMERKINNLTEVWQARDTKLDRNVVLKVLPVGPSRHRFVLTPAGGVV